MKNFQLIISLVIGIAIGFFIARQFSDLPETPPIQPLNKEKSALLEEAKTLLQDRRVYKELGNRIEISEMQQDTAAFLQFRRNIKHCLTDQATLLSSSYSFGLEEVRALLRDCDLLNRMPRHQMDSIAGIRVNMGMDSVTFSGTDIAYIDVFLSPVTKSGTPIFKDYGIVYQNIRRPGSTRGIPKPNDNSGGLNVSNPCPDVCP